VLTEAGRALAEGAEEIERTLNLMRARLLRDEAGPTGVVRVGAFYSFLNAVLIPQLPSWRERFPGLRFELVESDNEHLLRLLRTGELDAVVLEFDAGERSRAPSAQVTEVPLLDEPWKLVVPAGTLQTTDVVAIDRITLPWLGVDTSAATEHAVRRVRLATGRSGSTVHTYQETQTAIALVAAGEGVALIPSLALRGVDRTGIEALDVPGLGTRRIVLRRHDRRGVPEAVRVASSLIREAAATLDFDDDI
jgi:DNA-binding transcriptional LysR family regulator